MREKNKKESTYSLFLSFFFKLCETPQKTFWKKEKLMTQT